MAYIFLHSLRRNNEGFIISFLLIFTIVWMCYFVFWISPWPSYFLAPNVIVILFISKLFNDFLVGLSKSFKDFFVEIKNLYKPGAELTLRALMVLGSLTAFVSMSLWGVYEAQSNIRDDVFTKADTTIGMNVNSNNPRYDSQIQITAYIKSELNPTSVIETWERELDILTGYTFHFPDQSLLAYTHSARYLNGSHNYLLGEDYFNKIRPSYVVLGRFARQNPIYSPEYLNAHGKIIKSINNEEWGYVVYQMDYSNSKP